MTPTRRPEAPPHLAAATGRRLLDIDAVADELSTSVRRVRRLDGGDAAVVEETYLGYLQKRLVAKRGADVSVFSSEELVVVDQVIEALQGRSARDVSERSHDEVGWQMVDVGETIPYEAAYLRQPVLTPAEKRHAAALAEQRGRS